MPIQQLYEVNHTPMHGYNMVHRLFNSWTLFYMIWSLVIVIDTFDAYQYFRYDLALVGALKLLPFTELIIQTKFSGEKSWEEFIYKLTKLILHKYLLTLYFVSWMSSTRLLSALIRIVVGLSKWSGEKLFSRALKHSWKSLANVALTPKENKQFRG